MGIVFKLIIEDDDGKTTVVPLSRSEISIGRMEGNTIRLMERNVSRRHARLVRQNGSVLIEDLNSFNGVKLNGERIDQRIEIKEGDLVEIGDYHLALQAQEIAETATNGSASATTAPILEAPSVPPASRHASDSSVLPPFPASGVTSALGLGGSTTSPDGTAPRTEQLVVGPPAVATHARLICVSTEYAGREYALTRPETIIGRVEDNDVIIEHRSVSRNHAKVVFDGRVHKIIDLESANGILVNGEEYAITDLRKNDLIECGHVCFRFIPAGEPFAPTEEEARNMLAAGVAPGSARSTSTVSPRAPSSSGAISAPPVPPDNARTVRNSIDMPLEGHDPSSAKTVTDTPLSALAPEPLIKPAPRGVSDSVHTEDAPTEAVLPKEPPAASKPPRPRPRPVEQAAVTQTASSGSKTWVLAAIAAVVVIVLAVVAFKVLGGSDAHDKQLQGLFDAGKFEEVEKYYLEHQSEFKDGKKAYLLTTQATRAKEQKAPPPPPPQPEKGAEVAPPPPPTEPAKPVEATAVAEKPAAEKPAELPAGDPPEAEAAGEDGAKKPAKGGRTARAKKLEQTATRALMNGDQKGAVSLYEQCIAIAELPECHRGLGTAFRQTDEVTRSCFHFERYLQLAPNAPEAERVQEIFKQQCR